MSFSTKWDTRYSENTHLSVWPWSDLVSYFYRYAKPFSSSTKVLEIGFGAGANIPFFRALKIDYSGIEGSSVIHSKVCERYPDLTDKLYLGDFVSSELTGTYDVIVDRGSMICNTTLAIRNSLKHLASHMDAGGKYIGIDWYSTAHSDFRLGEVIDEFTRCNIPEGQFVGLGNVHFSTKEHIAQLFSEAGFQVTRLEHKQSTTEIPNVGHLFASWNLVAEKK